MPDGATIKHLMVLVDGTEASFRAVDFALDLATMIQARVTALAVVETETLKQLLKVRILAPSEMSEFEDELRQNCERALKEVAERAKVKEVEVECVLASGNSEVIVPREVEERGVGLFVLGKFECARAMRDLVARQRQQIVDRAPCHILVVK